MSLRAAWFLYRVHVQTRKPALRAKCLLRRLLARYRDKNQMSLRVAWFLYRVHYTTGEGGVQEGNQTPSRSKGGIKLSVAVSPSWINAFSIPKRRAKLTTLSYSSVVTGRFSSGRCATWESGVYWFMILI